MEKNHENNKVQNCVPTSSKYGDEYIEQSLRDFAHILYGFLMIIDNNE